VTVAEAVDRHTLFAVEAQREKRDATTERHPQRRFECFRGPAPAGQDVHRSGDHEDDRHVARRLHPLHRSIVCQQIGGPSPLD
jgi:hypothetical protein